MTKPAPGPVGRRRWWTLGLLAHAVLVAVMLLTDPPSLSADPDSWAARADYAGRLALSTPWWLLPVPFGGLNLISNTVTPLAQALPLVATLVLHAAAVPLLMRRPRTAGAGAINAAHRRHDRDRDEVRAEDPSRSLTGTSSKEDAQDQATRRVESRPWLPALSASTVFFAAATAGDLVWAAWLGWDDTTSYDVLTRQVESPYVSLQVLGCALSVGVLTAAIAARWSPVASAGGVSAGFWFCWTAWAANDQTGMFMIGGLTLGAGLLVGTAAAATVGRAVARRPARAGADLLQQGAGPSGSQP